MKIVIAMEGGVIQNVLSDDPNNTDIVLLDWDEDEGYNPTDGPDSRVVELQDGTCVYAVELDAEPMESMVVEAREALDLMKQRDSQEAAE